ncbi:hypothetical protein JW933_11305 [candidate division FCPU426 bacterium]|nr:hypothetical protein [candidate division FCPU426 bacterium]
MGNIKAIGFITIAQYISEYHGAEISEKIKNTLEGKDQEALFAKNPLPISWIDYGAYIRYLITADKILGNGDLKMAEKLVSYEVNKNFKTIYKMFVALATPTLLFAKTPMMFKQYFDAGKMSAEVIGKNQVDFKLADFPNVPLHHEFHFHVVFTELGKMAGGKVTEARHAKCLARGDEYCISHLTWSSI